MATRQQLERRRRELGEDAPELVELRTKWSEAISAAIDVVEAYQPAPHMRLSPAEAVQEVLTTGATCIRNAYSKEEMISVLKRLEIEASDPYSLFWHDPQTKHHIGLASTLPVNKETGGVWDPKPVLDAVAPNMSLPDDIGWFIMALPKADRKPPMKCAPRLRTYRSPQLCLKLLRLDVPDRQGTSMALNQRFGTLRSARWCPSWSSRRRRRRTVAPPSSRDRTDGSAHT